MRFLIVAGVAALAAGAASAQSVDADALVKCAGIGEDAKRLECYDNAVSKLGERVRAAEAKRRAEAEKIAKRRAEDEAKRNQDKFGAENIGPSKAEELYDARRPDRIEAKVAEVLISNTGSGAVFILDNGQMWRQDGGMQLPPIKAGEAIRIDRGIVGGYKLTIIKRGRSVPVRRMR
jgi:hypothetical protein